MNEDMEKLDQLLADMPKREYDLDAWLAEDETAKFDRIVSKQHIPSGFDAGSDGKTIGSKHRTLWRRVAAAACFLLIIGIGLHYQFEEPVVTSDVTLGNTARYQKQQAPLPKVTSEPTPEPTPKPSTPQTDSGHTIAAPVRTPRTESPLPAEKESAPYGQISASQDPSIHYASNDLTKDTIPYQDPARVDDFIAKLAEYHKVKQGELTCSQPIDSSVVSSVYVFPDKDDINLFSRLLQVACWYNSKTPGYHLNFSQQQFFFELKDMRRQLQYRWIAERINGCILFYSTQAPIGAKESSACYQQYRDELMYQNNFKSKTKKL